VELISLRPWVVEWRSQVGLWGEGRPWLTPDGVREGINNNKPPYKTRLLALTPS
jgi:hypothetical protein